MSEVDPQIQDGTPPWDFGEKDTSGNMATKADLARLESMMQQMQRPRVDTASLDEGDREVAAILEALEKNPVKGFKDHTQFIVKGVTQEVTKAMLAKMTEMQQQQQLPLLRERIVAKIGSGLGDAAKEYIAAYLETYDGPGLEGIVRHKPTLDTLRLAAEQVNAKGGKITPPPGTGGVGTVAPPEGITDAQEADAQEMLANMKGVPGFDIERARAIVKGLPDELAGLAGRGDDMSRYGGK